MGTCFYDRQDEQNELNGTALVMEQIGSLLSSLHNRDPFFFELVRDDGTTLLVGYAGDCGCAQFSATDGSPPYWLAREPDRGEACEGNVEYLIGGTPTPVPNSNTLTRSMLVGAIEYFVSEGGRLPALLWDEV